MKILVTGREGQVARALAGTPGLKDCQVDFLARPEFDLADPDSIRRVLGGRDFDVIINAAAYTAVDQAEDQPELAHRINAVAPGVMAEIAASRNAAIIQLSTDYVFDGSGNKPWSEGDPTGPLGVYGRTKLAGEQAVRAAAPDNHLVLRTAWVYSPFGNNFVRTMLRLAETKDRISVVNDQFGNPTSALDIATGIGKIISTWQSEQGTTRRRGLGSTFHLAGLGEASWFDVAAHVFAISSEQGGPTAFVDPICSEDFPSKAQRPKNSRLSSTCLHSLIGWRAPNWRNSVMTVVELLVSKDVK